MAHPVERRVTSAPCLAAFAALLLSSAAAHAVPRLNVSDNYALNTWTPPATCSAQYQGVLNFNTCPVQITVVTGTPAGLQLGRSNSAPSASGFTRAGSFDNGILSAIAEGRGPEQVQARSRFRETYTYTGAPTANYLVGFTITPFRASVTSAGAGDTCRAWLDIDILVNSVSKADPAWTARAQQDGNLTNDFAMTPPPVPVAGVTLPAGFLGFSGVSAPDVSAGFVGPGGTMIVDLGAFVPGQIFSLDYRMSCRVRGTGAGNGFCLVGDPFSIPSGPGIDFGGFAIPAPPVPTPAALALLGLGVLALASRRRPR